MGKKTIVISDGETELLRMEHSGSDLNFDGDDEFPIQKSELTHTFTLTEEGKEPLVLEATEEQKAEIEAWSNQK